MDSGISEAEKAKITQIVEYWFEPLEDGTPWDRHTVSNPRGGKKWFMGGAKVDEECRQMFKDDLDAAGRGEREHWKADRDGNLAFILLNDQMSRNIYRGTA